MQQEMIKTHTQQLNQEKELQRKMLQEEKETQKRMLEEKHALNTEIHFREQKINAFLLVLLILIVSILRCC